MAHLLEHMLFKGTELNPDIPKALKDRGADFNGTTWLDRTNYYETLPANDDNLEFAIRLEADRLVNSKILGEDLQKSSQSFVANSSKERTTPLVFCSNACTDSLPMAQLWQVHHRQSQ